MEPEIVGNRVMKLMKEHKMGIEELAKKMEINKKSLEKKLKGEEEFYIEEMHKIQEIFDLNLKEIDDLFFKKNKNISKIKSTSI